MESEKVPRTILNGPVSKHFKYSEVIGSVTATQRGINNALPPSLFPRVKLLAERILEPTREYFASPIIVSSWYRCAALNQIVSNNPDSQHVKGEAVDFVVRSIPTIEVAKFIRDHLEFDQLILERSWVHVSLVENGNRKEVKTTSDGRIFKEGLK